MNTENPITSSRLMLLDEPYDASATQVTVSQALVCGCNLNA